MSATLYALVVLQGTGLSFSPGYTSASECMQQYKGPYVSCFAYDPDSTSWTAFFKLPTGGFRTVGSINSEDECKRYIGAFKDDVPAACRQLALPATCSAACRLPTGDNSPPPPPPPAMPEKTMKPGEPFAQPSNDIQVNGRRYTRLGSLFWAPMPSEDTFASFLAQPEQRKRAKPVMAARRQQYAPNPFDLIASLFVGSW